MSGYQERHGPNVSQYMDSLNGLNQMDFNLGDDYTIPDASQLDMFINTNFTEIGGAQLSDAGGDINFNFDATPAESPNGAFSTFNHSNLQPAPPVFGYPHTLNQQNAPAASLSPTGSEHILKRKLDNSESSTAGAEESSRQAAEEDKRRRNTAASARFRQKKKAKEANMEQVVKEIQDENIKLKSEVTKLRNENQFLKGLIMEKDGSENWELTADKLHKAAEERDAKVETKQGVGTAEEA